MSCFLSRLACVALLVAGVFSPAFATPLAGGSCESLFRVEKVSRSQSLKGQSTAAQAEAQVIIDRMFTTISFRGFISSKPAPYPELQEALAKKGIIWWYLRIFVAESLEAAKAHSALEKDSLMQGVYLIDPNNTKGLTERPAPEVFKRLMLSNAMYYVHKADVNGAVSVEKVDPEIIRQALSPEKLTWDLNDPEHGPYIKQTGWAFPRERGVILYANTLDSKNYHRARGLARRLISEGWKIRFNKDFQGALNKVRDQKRLIEGQWVANSLYLDKDNYDMTLDAFKNGKAFSVEVWNEKDELIGGLIGLKEGAVYSPDSVFYDADRYPKISISFGKIGIVAMMDRLHEAGIPFADAGMVSPFTESMRGQKIPGPDFLPLMESLGQARPVDETSDWVP